MQKRYSKEFKETVNEINTFNEIKATTLEENKEKSEGKIRRKKNLIVLLKKQI